MPLTEALSLCRVLQCFRITWFLVAILNLNTSFADRYKNKGNQHHFVDFRDPYTKFRYAIPGELNIGAILPIHQHSNTSPCGDKLRESGVVQYVEAIAFAINQINQDQTLLDGIKLGMVVLDDCDSAETSLGQSLHFMPLQSIQTKKEDCPTGCADYKDDEYMFYDVVGVIGTEGSDASMMIANVLKLFQLPQISPFSTSDLLSEKKKYPYFMRTVPPDRFQVEAMLHLILHFNWTYIATVYTEGGYGEEAFELFQVLIEQEKSICIGKAITVTPEDSVARYRRTVQALYDSKVLVVVLFTDQEEVRAILSAAKSLGLVGQFVWIGSDGMAINIDDFDGLEDVIWGSLSLLSYSVPVPEFQNYFESINPLKTPNPWFKEMWGEMFKCTFEPDREPDLPLCTNKHKLSDSRDYTPEAYVSTVIDTVYVYADALDKYIKERCRGFSRENVRSCIDGRILMDYLHNVTLPGHNGIITFDANGDVLGKYEIHNYQRSGSRYVSKQVGVFDSSTNTLHINESEIMWNLSPERWKESNTKTGLLKNQIVNGVPQSQCGETCSFGEIYSYFRDTCCWECRPCNKNEITIANATKCLTCPLYTWPNENSTQCLDLEPYYMNWGELAAIILVCISIVGTIACTTLFIVFLLHNDNRLIKATSRELSYIMLGGVTIQYIMLLTIVAKPTDFVCYFNYIGFNVSFCVVYAPLLTRTNRIYRIFRAGRRTKVLPSLTSPVSQVIIALSLVAIQVIINIIVIVSSPPAPIQRMPIATEPHTELVCGLPVQGFVTSMCYNFLLVLTCTFYAFKTRSLPDNFNESRYITLSVYTTLVIWMTFMPTYFTNRQSFYQIILLSCALILNASVILLCLFVPKVYAIYSGVQTPNGFKFAIRKPALGEGIDLASRPMKENCLRVDDDNTEMSDFPTGVVNGGGSMVQMNAERSA